MEEVLSWFEDEKSRREELLRACQNSHQWPLSPANTISSGLNRTLALTMFQHDSQSPGSSIPMQDTFPLHVPWTPSEDHVQAMAGEKRGRRSKQSLTPSSSPSPEAKRQKRSTEYPCPDCRKFFTADRWSEHVKRTHFPDQIWECQNINERTKKPCTSKPFFRAENFKTHLIGQHSCSNEEISRLAKACRFPVMNFFHQKCGFLGCGETFDAREDSIEHIKNHFRQIAQRSNPPKDLGVSQWEENCASAHILKRGVHYRVVLGTARNNSEHNRDSNNDDGSGNDYSSSRPHKNSQSGPDEGAPPGGEDTSSDSAHFDSGQDSSYMSYGQYSAISPQIESKSKCATQSSSYTIGLEQDVLPFTIRRRLGFGGHGLVDEVFSVSSKETFARKSVLLSGGISDTSPQMVHLKNELSILKGLSHPHLVKLIGAYADAKYSHIIMSPVADQNLADYMLSSLSAGNEGLYRWMGCLTSAIYYLHGQGIQHLDIKPQNILLKGDHILLADFGTAKSFEGWPMNRTILAVTPMYSAPETMLYGRQEFCSDIFSLGCVFSEMMTRQSGRSIRQFEEFRSRSGKKAFHLTISEVRNWITFLPWTIPSNRLLIHPAEDQKKMGETILQMLAEVSSDRPTSSDLQSCFIELGCHQCKPVTSEETAPSSPAAPDEDSSENSPSCGTALSSKPIGSKASTNITLSEASATTSPEIIDVDCIDDADRRNSIHSLSLFFSSLDKISLSTGIGKTTSQNPAQSSSKSGDSSTEEVFAARAAKSDFTCPRCRNVFNDMKAHMLTHQNEPSIKCPIQICRYHTKDFAEEHDKPQKLLSQCENPTFCGSCPSSQSMVERTCNWTEALEKHPTKVHGIGEIPDNDSALSSLGNMSGEPSTRYSDHQVESPAYASAVENELNVHEHLKEYVPGIKCEWDEAASVNVQLMKEGNTKPIMLKTTQETIHRGSSQLQADYDMPRFSTDNLAASSNYVIFPSRNRTYSVSSNGTSDQGLDSPLNSTQGDPGTPATEFADDTQAMSEDAKSLVQYDPKVVLSRLYSKGM
jgi:serine/threonine protein kinase